MIGRQTRCISLKYEKPPKICFGCGCILHAEGECFMNESSLRDQYGGWLRAKITRKSWSKPVSGESRNQWSKPIPKPSSMAK